MTHSSPPLGVHDYLEDPRNKTVLISINGVLFPRDKAVISVFDSGFLLGDGIWEGLRLYKNGLAFLDPHIDRLFEGAKTLDIDLGIDKNGLKQRLFDCLKANEMTENVHIRLMATRGIKKSPYQGPRFTIGTATTVIIPEYKQPLADVADKGVRLITSHIRRTGPAEQDQKLNSHSKLNCIQACIDAEKAGADEALMLDPDGFVATCNSTHFFIVKKGEVWTSPTDYCLGGITRHNMIRLCDKIGLPVREKRFSLHDVYNADEAFLTGTFAGLTPIREVDSRTITHVKGPVSCQLLEAYKDLVIAESTPIS